MKPWEMTLIAGATLLFFTLNAQVSEGQEWTLRKSDSANMVNLRLEVNQKRGLGWSRSSHSTDIPWSSIEGLKPGQLDTGSTNAKFAIVRDAGRFVCEGITGLGRGTGSFRFEASPTYAERLRQLGYTSPDSEQVFSMAMHDISLEFAKYVRDTGLRASTKELIELRIHGVAQDYIAEMRNFGFTELVARDFVEMKIHGVQPEFVRGLKAAGYNLTAREIVEMKIHGIDSQYIRELHSYGLNPPARDLVEMKIHGVRPEYLKALKDAGFQNLTPQDVTNLKIHGVSPEFIKDTKSMGYNFSLRELTEMKIHGVSTPYLQKLRASGFKDLTADKIVKLRIHGID